MEINMIDGNQSIMTETRALPLSAAMPDECSWSAQPDELDLAAEREAAAVAFLEEELDIRGSNVPMFEQRLAQQPVIRNQRYNWVKSCRAHQKIEDHYRKRLAGESSTLVQKLDITTNGERHRRQLRHEQRKLLLAALEGMQQQWVPFPMALQLVDCAARTMHRAMMEGRLQKRVIDRKVHVASADLKTFLRAKVSA